MKRLPKNAWTIPYCIHLHRIARTHTHLLAIEKMKRGREQWKCVPIVWHTRKTSSRDGFVCFALITFLSSKCIGQHIFSSGTETENQRKEDGECGENIENTVKTILTIPFRWICIFVCECVWARIQSFSVKWVQRLYVCQNTFSTLSVRSAICCSVLLPQQRTNEWMETDEWKKQKKTRWEMNGHARGAGSFIQKNPKTHSTYYFMWNRKLIIKLH